MKIKILNLVISSTDGNDYIIKEVKATRCSWLEDSAWVINNGQWYLYDLRTGLWIMREDSRAYIESQKNYIITMMEVRRKSALYQRRVNMYKELTSV